MSESAESTKVDRENVYKRRPEIKSNLKLATDDYQDGDSVPSLKASSNPPLPQLPKDKRKLVIKTFGTLEAKTIPAFVEKQVRQHDNILLKQRNNLLSSENLKLKTRLAVLEKQNQRLQKSIENQNGQAKPNTCYGNNRDRIKAADNTLRAVIRGLRKEVEDFKKENLNIKSAIKFTSLKELETERDHLAEETIRLRLTLQEEQARRTSTKSNSQGVSTLQHRLQHLSDKNTQLTKELNEAVEKCKKLEEVSAKGLRAIENDKKNARALQTAILQIREKDAEIEQLKAQLKTSHSLSSTTFLQQQQTPKENKFDIKRSSIERKSKNFIPQTKPTVQKFTPIQKCQKCIKLESENKKLLEKVKKIESEVAKGKQQYGQLPKGPIAQVKQSQVDELVRFLSLRFKAHRLTFEQSEKYLINCEGVMSEDEMNKPISSRELMQSLFVQPFCIVSNRYIEVLLAKLVYGSSKSPISIDDCFEVKKKAVIEAYRSLMPMYKIMNMQKEEQMFFQVTELITTYYQQVLGALNAKRNGEGTISEGSFLEFFREIQLEQEYIDFIITQIILESLDMNHLNFYAMFQIFYNPQIGVSQPATLSQKKKKFQVQHQQVVHQEDEEYEESKSHLGSRNKTLQHRQKETEEYGWQQSKEKKQQNKGQSRVKGDKEKRNNEGEQEIYEQQFEQTPDGN